MNFMIKVIQPSDFSNIDLVIQFQSEIESVLESEADIILVDLKNLTSISSDSFITLADGLNAVLRSGRQLSLCSVNEQVKILFELTGLDQILQCFSDYDEFHQSIQPATTVEALRSTKLVPGSLQLAV